MFQRVGLAVIRDGQLLLVRQNGAPFWAIPGGHSEKGETPRDTLERELREELGVSLADAGFQLVETFIDRAAETGEDFRLTLCVGDIVGTPSPSAEIAEYLWYDGTLPDGELPPMFVNHVQPTLRTRLGWRAKRDQ